MVESSALLKRRTVKGTEGSNPSLTVPPLSRRSFSGVGPAYKIAQQTKQIFRAKYCATFAPTLKN